MGLAKFGAGDNNYCSGCGADNESGCDCATQRQPVKEKKPESNFTDGLPRVATEEDCQLRWGCGKPGERFRCYLCGHRFVPGDVWRFVWDNDGNGCGGGNFMVCTSCDCLNVREVWKQHVEKFRTAYWWAQRE